MQEPLEKQHVIGAILGEAIGDALGHPIEFKKTHKVEGMPSENPEENKFTDDTQMFVAIGEAMLEAPPHVDEEKFMVTLGEKFDNWRHNPLGGSHRAPGGNCMDAVRKLGAGVHWTKTGGLDFKGNGSAMRSGIVGAYYWKNPQYAFRIGGLTSVCTHNNLEPIMSSAVVAYLVAASIKGVGLQTAVAQVLRLCEDFETTLPFYPRQVKFGNGYSDQSPWYAIARFGAAVAFAQTGMHIEDVIPWLHDPESVVMDGAGVPAVAEAIYFNLHSGKTGGFDKIVLDAVNNSDDTDTIGAIAGTIAGARCGFSNIPAAWSEKVEMAPYLFHFGTKIWDASLAYVEEQKEADNVLGSVDIGALLVENEGSESDESDFEVEF